MVASYGTLYHAVARLCVPSPSRTYISSQNLSRMTIPLLAIRDRVESQKIVLSSSHASFSTVPLLRYPQREPHEQEQSQGQKRKSTRSPTKKTSLRRVAVEAQRSRGGTDLKKPSTPEAPVITKVGQGRV